MTHNHVVLRGDLTNKNHYISTTTVFMATKHGRMVTLEKLLLIKLYDRLIMWSCKITWQTKTSISPLPQYLRPFLRLTLRGSFPLRKIALKLRCLARSRNKLKTCLHYHNAYEQQTFGGWWHTVRSPYP